MRPRYSFLSVVDAGVLISQEVAITMNLVSVGAFDRFNYGDLLFPLVLDSVWSEFSGSSMSHFALHGAGGSAWGTSPSRSARELKGCLEGNLNIDGCIVAGGDVLGASWFDLAWHSLPSIFDLPVAALCRIVPRSALSSICRKLAGGKWKLPFVPDVPTALNIPIVYNAVGATSMSGVSDADRRYIVQALKAASYVSVRDDTGYDLLRKEGIDCLLVPDSASVISQLLPAYPKQAGTVVFQCSRHWLRAQDEVEVVRQVKALADSFDHVYLLAIGLAGGHSDLSALRKIQRALRLDTNNVSIVHPKNISEVAQPIASAECYVGSSLHGAITALAYGTPVVGLSHVPKLTAYLRTWASEISHYDVGSSNILEAVEQSRGLDRARLLAHGKSLSDRSLSATRSMLESLVGVG